MLSLDQFVVLVPHLLLYFYYFFLIFFVHSFSVSNIFILFIRSFLSFIGDFITCCIFFASFHYRIYLFDFYSIEFIINESGILQGYFYVCYCMCCETGEFSI